MEILRKLKRIEDRHALLLDRITRSVSVLAQAQFTPAVASMEPGHRAALVAESAMALSTEDNLMYYRPSPSRGSCRMGTQAMLRIKAGDFHRHVGRYQDAALTQPVAITRGGQERVVMVSAEEYYRLKRRDRQVLLAAELTQEDVDALEATRAPESSKAFDGELNF